MLQKKNEREIIMRKGKRAASRLLAFVLVPGMFLLSSGMMELRAQETRDVIHITSNADPAPEKSGQETIGHLKKRIQLQQPASFEAKPAKNGITLGWKKASKIRKYEIYRKKAGAKAYTLIKTTKKAAYTDKKVAYGVTYMYKVRAVTVINGKTYKSACSEKKGCCTYFIDPAKPMVALTFDDGPSQYTPGILDTLEKYRARATFFEVGNRVNRFPDTVRRIDQMGCEIGNHSYDHAQIGTAAASKIRFEIDSTDEKIKAITGKAPALLRPPYGAVGTSLKNDAKKPLILWSIDTLDWQSRNADKIYQSVLGRVSDGDIILMHDLYYSTEKAVERIVPQLKKRGYQLVTVSELAKYRNVKLCAGKSYSQIMKR